MDDFAWLDLPYASDFANEQEEELEPLGMDSDVQENRRCLIADSLYINAYRDDLNGSYYSLDKLRLNMKVDPEVIDDAVTRWVKPKAIARSHVNKIGGYVELHTCVFERSSVTVGVGHRNGSGSLNLRMGFVEFNPNKVGKEGLELIERLKTRGARFSIARYDLAIDFPIERSLVRLVKDRRAYETRAKKALTEYLGVRNAVGRVKVYDKQAESHLSEPLTRVELTCDGSWDANSVLGKLPIVVDWASADLDGLQRMTRLFAMSVQRNIECGDTLEDWLVRCDYRSRKAIRDAFKRGKTLNYNLDCINGVLGDALSFCNGKKPGI